MFSSVIVIGNMIFLKKKNTSREAWNLLHTKDGSRIIVGG